MINIKYLKREIKIIEILKVSGLTVIRHKGTFWGDKNILQLDCGEAHATKHVGGKQVEFFWYIKYISMKLFRKIALRYKTLEEVPWWPSSQGSGLTLPWPGFNSWSGN